MSLRYGWTSMPKALVQYQGGALDGKMLQVAVEDAMREARLTYADRFYVRIAVIELPPTPDLDIHAWQQAAGLRSTQTFPLEFE